MRPAEGDLVPKPRMQWIGLAWFCRLTRKPKRLAHRCLVPGLRNSLPALRAALISYPGPYHTGAPLIEHAEIPDATRHPTPLKPATA
jgi:hypothetical protein